jgi:hypothetical protein
MAHRGRRAAASAIRSERATRLSATADLARRRQANRSADFHPSPTRDRRAQERAPTAVRAPAHASGWISHRALRPPSSARRSGLPGTPGHHPELIDPAVDAARANQRARRPHPTSPARALITRAAQYQGWPLQLDRIVQSIGPATCGECKGSRLDERESLELRSAGRVVNRRLITYVRTGSLCELSRSQAEHR